MNEFQYPATKAYNVDETELKLRHQKCHSDNSWQKKNL